jgi:acyl carrier protein
MELNDFINNFISQLDTPPTELVTGETDFRNFESWDSLTALSIMAMVDSEYEVNLTGQDIQKSNTINDIFEIIKTKKK